MHHHEKAGVAPATEAVATGEEGRYLYCVGDGGEKVSLGKIGIDAEEVYTVPFQDICALVHNCPAVPYHSDDQEVMAAWVASHQRVVETAWERWGTVLPSGFDNIIRAEREGDAERNVQDWLQQEYERLKKKIEELRGKAEYGVQVFWDPKLIARNLLQTDMELRSLDQEIGAKPRGSAYMCRQRLERILKVRMEKKASECFQDFYSRIKRHSADIRAENTKAADAGLQMVMNLSCLVDVVRYPELGEELDEINQIEAFSVRFTGPWPPYSFVGNL